MTDLMIDLETLGTGSQAVILSIGACLFDRERVTATIKWNTIPDFERFKADPGTFYWWIKQSKQAREALINPEPITLEAALIGLSAWVNMRSPKWDSIRVWSNGATFDIPILANAYRTLGKVEPWRYTLCRDTRTLWDYFPPLAGERAGVAHDAAHDARNQALAVISAWEYRERQARNLSPEDDTPVS